MQAEPEFPLRRYLRFLQRQALPIVLTASLAIAATAALTFLQDPVYRAKMKMVVVQAGGEREPDFGSEEVSQTMANLLESDAVAREVIRNRRLDATTKDVLKKLSVTFRPDSAVLDVSYDSPSKRTALQMLGEFSRVFERQVARKLGIRSETGALRRQSALPVITVSVFDPPYLLSDPVSPKPVKNIAFAAALGLILGIILAVMRESLDDRIRDREQAEDWFGSPVVGTLPKGARGRPPPGTAQARAGKAQRSGRDPLLEALQLLRARVEYSGSGIHGPTILVTSALNDEGKTTVAANLAAALALGGKRVVCVEADMRRPNLHTYLSLDATRPGLLDVLSGEVEVEEALQRVELFDPVLGLDGSQNGSTPRGELHVLPTGGTATAPGSLLSDEAVSNLIERLRSTADYVIFDAPPLLGLPDSLPLALRSDNILVVARRSRTTKGKAQAVRATLRELGLRSAGVIITDAPGHGTYGYGS